MSRPSKLKARLMYRHNSFARDRLKQARAKLTDLDSGLPSQLADDWGIGPRDACDGSQDAPSGHSPGSICPCCQRPLPDADAALAGPKSLELITQRDAAREFHAVPRTLRNWTKKGFLKPVRIAGRVYYTRNELNALIESGMV